MHSVSAHTPPVPNVAAVRLAGYGRVATADPDEAAEAIGRIFCPHALDPVAHSRPAFHALHNSARFAGFSVNYVRYGGTVSIDPGCLDQFFLLQIPLTGAAEVTSGATKVAARPAAVASLLSPTLPTRMVWHDDCAKLILLIERGLIEARAAALFDRSVKAIEFEPEVDLATSFGRALEAQVDYLVAIAESLEAGRSLPPALVANFRETFLGLLLTGQRHSLSDRFLPETSAPPRAVRRAAEFLDAHASEPLDLEKLAAIAGTGIRALQIAFKRHFGLSISDKLLDLRLARLRGELGRAAPGARITDLALDLGFTHMGRMSDAYRARFGECPSDTLRRGKAD